jgi:hypothetical protein
MKGWPLLDEATMALISSASGSWGERLGLGSHVPHEQIAGELWELFEHMDRAQITKTKLLQAVTLKALNSGDPMLDPSPLLHEQVLVNAWQVDLVSFLLSLDVEMPQLHDLKSYLSSEGEVLAATAELLVDLAQAGVLRFEEGDDADWQVRDDSDDDGV